MREIRANPETDKVYAASMDGTQVEHWIADLCAAFKKPMDVTTVWGLSTCESAFLRRHEDVQRVLDRLHSRLCAAGARVARAKALGHGHAAGHAHEASARGV